MGRVMKGQGSGGRAVTVSTLSDLLELCEAII